MLESKSLLVGESQVIQNLHQLIDKVSKSDSNVLITGESGTGKELVARAIHMHSARAQGPLVTVNCGAIPGDLLEAELFGHMKGAFTGATQNRAGRFELANGGTIFLDEVGDLPLHLQVKLLRVIQTRQFEVVGSSKTVEVNVRIIAATNQDLEEQVQKKMFRDDLYYRLNVIPVKIAPLRDRKTDIPILVRHFIAKFNRLTSHQVQAPTEQAMEALMQYDWPGNIRELENLVERLVIIKEGGDIGLDDLPSRVFRKYAESRPAGSGAVSEWDFPRMVLPQTGLDLKNVVSSFENHLIDQALARTGGNKNRASELLQMNRTTLVEKLRKRGMIKPAKGKTDGEGETANVSGAGPVTADSSRGNANE